MKHTPHHTQHKSHCTDMVHEARFSSDLSPIEENSTLEGGDNIGEEVLSDVCDYQDTPVPIPLPFTLQIMSLVAVSLWRYIK